VPGSSPPDPINEISALHVIQRVETALMQLRSEVETFRQEIKAAIGAEGEDEYGKPTGTGLRGRVMRIERERSSWKLRFAGAMAALTLLFSLGMWMLTSPIKDLLKEAL